MEISEIKQRLSITDVLSHYNIKPDKNARMCCPFHDDKTPSVQVYEKTNRIGGPNGLLFFWQLQNPWT
jgi:DNA primase